MKKYIIITMIFTLGTLISCLNEDPLFDPSKSTNIIEFFDIAAISSPAGAIHPLYVSSFKAVPTVDFKVIISYSGAHSNDEDITVNVEVSQVALDNYNEEQGTSYEVLPPNLYTIPGFTVTIPKGETKAELIFALKTQDFDFTKAYALPLRIVSSSKGIISGNFGTAIFSIGAKNKYDGLYEVTGTFVDALSPAFTGIYPKQIELRTVDINTVNYYDHEYLLDGHVFNTGSGASYYGNFSIQFDFDNSNESDNVDPVLTARNALFDPAPRSRGGKLGTGANIMTFKSDGTPETLQVTYILTQNGGAVNRTTFTETYTYIGER